MPRQIRIIKYGGPEVLQDSEFSNPPLKGGEVLIEVRACGVNFADLMMRMGVYPEAPKRPFTPGYEVSGVVLQTGASVQDFKAGDRVLAACRFGGYATHLTLASEQVWKIPPHLSFEEAASIPVNFITAWVALEDMARVREGDRVLVQSAAGGVGVAAIQIAKRRGAHVTGLTSSFERKSAFIKSLGADEVVAVSEWEKSDEKRFKKFEVILDSTGGSSLKRSFRRLSPGGRLVQYGVSAMIGGNKRSILSSVATLLRMPLYHPLSLMNENKGVFGVNILQLFEPAQRALPFHAMNEVIRLFEKKEFRVSVGQTFPLQEAGAAHQFLASRAATGKVILTCRS